ncbi:MAG: transposase [Prevotella sp.]|nr:transposase [Prevotella sp.]MDY4150309.1 transposase [Prevotella sp.]
MAEQPSYSTTKNGKRLIYIDGVGWRYATEHRMTRWPLWKDSRKPGTYMITLNINGSQKLLGTLAGSSAAIYGWMKEHPEEVKAASADAYYYRHALLGTGAMPFVLKPVVETTGHKEQASDKAQASYMQASDKAPTSYMQASDMQTSYKAPTSYKQPSSCGGVSTPSAKSRTHFPLPALSQPGAPHIELSPLGIKVKESLERMPQVEPKIELVCYSIMPNHIHFIIAVRGELNRPIGTIIRSFMGATSRSLHMLKAEGKIQWNSAAASIARKASTEKPSLWQPGYCIGICHTEQKLHTRIGYVIENPFFGILETERHDFMKRTMMLTIKGRRYSGYGNMLLLKEPDRLQVFCHRNHPVTHEPYHLTQDFREEKQAILNAAADGVVIVTPGISPGEADIMWSVLQNGGFVINIQQEEIPINDKWHPEKERRIYCSQGQMLVLSVHDLPHQTFYDCMGQEIPMTTSYARFHLLNFVAEELCQEGIENECGLCI